MRFSARVGTPDGRVLEEVFEAADEAAARGSLESRGYHVFELEKRGLKFDVPLLRDLGSRKVTDREFLIFNQELASLLKAGLPLLHSINMMLERQRNPTFKAILIDVRDRLSSGEEMSEAFGRYQGTFPSLYASSLKAGERTGELESVIRRFIRYLKLVMDTRKKVVNALIYPTLLIALSLGMLAMMLIRVIPSFRSFFTALDVELPWITQVLLDLSDFLRSRSGLLAVLAVCAAIYFARRLTRSGPGRQWLDGLKLQIPLVGGVLHRFSLSEFCRSLSVLLSGGMPLVPSLEVSVGAVGNQWLKTRLIPIVSGVREGESLHQALDDTEVFTDLGIDMVKVGEATGALDEMLSNLSDFFDEEIETRIERMLSVLDPILLVIMGSAVSLLLLAMYLPLFSMLSQLN